MSFLMWQNPIQVLGFTSDMTLTLRALCTLLSFPLLVSSSQQSRRGIAYEQEASLPCFSPLLHTTCTNLAPYISDEWGKVKDSTPYPQHPDTSLLAPQMKTELTDMKWNLRTLSIPSAFSCRMTGAKLLRCISGTVD